MEENSYSSTSGKNHSYCGKTTKNSSNCNDGGLIKKGPWKPEEDQVLINHVNIHGPRYWSSIRSKGLLLRTGKSCRLRWVNKLRPDLKNGCKFTAEEERVVIELQSQLGNKWATIATYLTGRTDNDVKNFWSSRQKRLKRILQSQSPQPLKRIKTSSASAIPTRNCSLFIEVPQSSITEGEVSSKLRSSSSSSHIGTSTDTIQMPTLFPDATNPECPTCEVTKELKPECPIPLHEFPLAEILFPSIPPLQTDLQFPPVTQELADRLNSSFLHTFECKDEPVFAEISGQNGAIDNPVTLDTLFDDISPDMFDHIDPLPSPSSW